MKILAVYDRLASPSVDFGSYKYRRFLSILKLPRDSSATNNLL